MKRGAWGRRVRRWGLVAGLVVQALAIAAPGFGHGKVTVETVGGQRHIFEVEVAATDSARRRGLMFREALPEHAGMLFDFGRERRIAMWMKDTPLPLDMVFADGSGQVVRVAADTEPFSLEVVASGSPARYVLELNAGTAAARGITPGARLFLTGRDLRP